MAILKHGYFTALSGAAILAGWRVIDADSCPVAMSKDQTSFALLGVVVLAGLTILFRWMEDPARVSELAREIAATIDAQTYVDRVDDYPVRSYLVEIDPTHRIRLDYRITRPTPNDQRFRLCWLVKGWDGWTAERTDDVGFFDTCHYQVAVDKDLAAFPLLDPEKVDKADAVKLLRDKRVETAARIRQNRTKV